MWICLAASHIFMGLRGEGRPHLDDLRLPNFMDISSKGRPQLVDLPLASWAIGHEGHQHWARGKEKERQMGNLLTLDGGGPASLR